MAFFFASSPCQTKKLAGPRQMQTSQFEAAARSP